MSRLPLAVKEKAISLRKRGYALIEIANQLAISKGTASLWLRDITLDEKARKRLLKRRALGQYKSSLTWKKKREKASEELSKKVFQDLRGVIMGKKQKKIYCSLVFWCEGSKRTEYGLRFTNADPQLIQIFLYLLRNAFNVDESKFRIGLHLHEYHNEKKQKHFWSRVAGIPENKFIRVSWKDHTAKRLRKDYPGCVTIYYHDVKMARELTAVYEVFAKKLLK